MRLVFCNTEYTTPKTMHTINEAPWSRHKVRYAASICKTIVPQTATYLMSCSTATAGMYVCMYLDIWQPSRGTNSYYVYDLHLTDQYTIIASVWVIERDPTAGCISAKPEVDMHQREWAWDRCVVHRHAMCLTSYILFSLLYGLYWSIVHTMLLYCYQTIHESRPITPIHWHTVHCPGEA